MLPFSFLLRSRRFVPEARLVSVCARVLSCLVAASASLALTPNGLHAQSVQGAFAGNDPGLASIDVYYHVGPIQVGKTEDMTATEVSVSFIDVPANVSITASIAEASSSSVAEAFYAEAFSFSSDTNFVQIINGLREPSGFAANPDGRSTALAVHQLDNVRRFAEHVDSLDVIFYHGSTDAPTVDFVGRDGTVYAAGLSYGDRSMEYKSIKAGESVTIDVVRSANAEVLGSFVATIPAVHTGRAGFVMLRGFVDPLANAGGAALRITMVPASGAAYDFAPESSVSVEHAETDATLLVGSVYPNPVDQATTDVLVSVHTPSPATVRVYDLLGREVRGAAVIVRPGSPAVEVPVRSLAPGRYFVVVSNNDTRVTRPLTVIR